MKVKYINHGVEQMIDSIIGFQSEGESEFWSGALYHFYPQIDRDYAQSLPFPERKRYIESAIRAIYAEAEPEINRKAAMYNRYWAECEAQIAGALSDAFGVDCTSRYNGITARVGLNPVSPRYLREQAFDIFYLNSEKGAIGLSIHEIIHFVWFDVWHKLFGDGFEEYERPSLKWILSEMVVESIMRDPRLSSINPYFPRENGGGCIYPYFFDMRAGDGLILETLDRIYRSEDIQDFMRDSYAYCLEHEREIRSHIEAAESGGV